MAGLMPNPTPKFHYQFVDGNADQQHADALNQLGDQGYKATLMDFDQDAMKGRLVVLMELET
jgi:hypothetical protein